MKALWALVFSGLILLGPSCGLFSNDGDGLDTGLTGRVLAGPTCPVVTTDDPCPDRPFSATFDVYDSRERLVTRFQSDAEGFFEVALRPGTYTIIPGESAPIIHPRTQQQIVKVEPEGMTEVTLTFDTGIR